MAVFQKKDTKDSTDKIREDEITLNIVTVRRPRNVIHKLDQLLGEDSVRHEGIMNAMFCAWNYTFSW